MEEDSTNDEESKAAASRVSIRNPKLEAKNCALQRHESDSRPLSSARRANPRHKRNRPAVSSLVLFSRQGAAFVGFAPDQMIMTADPIAFDGTTTGCEWIRTGEKGSHGIAKGHQWRDTGQTINYPSEAEYFENVGDYHCPQKWLENLDDAETRRWLGKAVFHSHNLLFRRLCFRRCTEGPKWTSEQIAAYLNHNFVIAAVRIQVDDLCVRKKPVGAHTRDVRVVPKRCEHGAVNWRVLNTAHVVDNDQVRPVLDERRGIRGFALRPGKLGVGVYLGLDLMRGCQRSSEVRIHRQGHVWDCGRSTLQKVLRDNKSTVCVRL